jgi:hypothetical protein
MKKLPQDNAPSVMKPWIRSILEVLTGFETDIDKLKTFVYKGTISTVASSTTANTAKLINYPSGTIVPVITSGTGQIIITTANTTTNTGITYPVGLFTVAPTVLITPRSTGDTAITFLTSTSASETGFNASAQRTAAGTINFSWLAIGN